MLRIGIEYVIKERGEMFRTEIASNSIEKAINEFMDIEKDRARIVRLYVNDYEITKALEDINICL